jgi:hypothetical protein
MESSSSQFETGADQPHNLKISSHYLRSRDATSEQTQTLYLEPSEFVDLQPFWREKRM